MIANFFQKSKPINFLVLAVLLFLIWLAAIIVSFEGGFDIKTLIKYIAVFSVLVLSLFLLNFVITKNSLTEDNSYALLLFILGIGMFPEIFIQEKLILSHFILLLSFRRIYSLRSSKKVNEKIFDSGFWIGVSFLIYSFSIFYLIVLYAAIVFFKREHWRTFFMPIIGFLTPVFLCYVYYLWHDNLEQFTELTYLPIQFNLSFYLQSHLIGSIAVLTILTMVALFLTTSKSVSGKKDFKHTWYVLLVHTLVSLAIILLVEAKNSSEFLLLAFPGSILIANYLQIIQRYWLKEVILYILVITLVSSYFL